MMWRKWHERRNTAENRVYDIVHTNDPMAKQSQTAEDAGNVVELVSIGFYLERRPPIRFYPERRPPI